MVGWGEGGKLKHINREVILSFDLTGVGEGKQKNAIREIKLRKL